MINENHDVEPHNCQLNIPCTNHGIRKILSKQKQNNRIPRFFITSQLTDNQHGNQRGDLIIYQYYGGSNQQFFLLPIENNFYIQSSQTKLVLEVDQESQYNGTKIVERQLQNKISQQWHFQEQSHNSDLYYIYSVLNGKVLDVFEGRNKNNTKVIQWDYHGKSNQLWSVKRAVEK